MSGATRIRPQAATGPRGMMPAALRHGLGAALAVLVLLPFFGCGDRVAGGGVETNNTVAGTLLLPGGAPAAGARVALRRALSLSSPPLRETRADAQGRYSFSDVAIEGYTLEAEADGLGEVLRFLGRVAALDGGAALSGTLAHESFLAGVLAGPDGAGISGTVSVYGLGSSVRTEGDGAFRIAVPAGAFWVHAVPDDSALAPGDFLLAAGAPPVRLALGVAPVLPVEDFERPGDRSLLEPATGLSLWYAADDRKNGGRSSILPSSILADFAAAHVDSGHAGQGLHAAFMVDTTFEQPYAQIALLLGVRRTGYDLTSLDSLVLWVRGSGRIRVELQSRYVGDTLADWGHPGWDVDLPARWTRLALSAKTLRAPEGTRTDTQGVPWERAGRSVSEIKFLARQPVEIWLDDLSLHGVGLGDL